MPNDESPLPPSDVRQIAVKRATDSIERECAEKIIRMTGYGMALHVNDVLPDIREAITQADHRGALTRLWDNIEELETMVTEGDTVENVLRSWKIRATALQTLLAAQRTEDNHIT